MKPTPFSTSKGPPKWGMQGSKSLLVELYNLDSLEYEICGLVNEGHDTPMEPRYSSGIDLLSSMWSSSAMDPNSYFKPMVFVGDEPA